MPAPTPLAPLDSSTALLLETILKKQEELNQQQQKIFRLLSDRSAAHAELKQRVDQITLDLNGDENNLGLKATVVSHENRMNLVIGGATVLMFIGGLVGWALDRFFQFLNHPTH